MERQKNRKRNKNSAKGKKKEPKDLEKGREEEKPKKEKGSFGSGFRFALGSRKVHTESHRGTYVCFTVAECTMCSFGLPKATQVMNGRA